MEKNENMAIYNAGRAVPDEAKKQFNNGRFSGTDINPMWRIKKLTELFGAAGIGWFYEVLSERCEQHDDVTIAVVDLNLYVKLNGEWSKPIYGTGGNIIVRKGTVSDEGYKMALTDALSVACKALGIGADVYFDKDKTKYTGSETPQTTLICADCGAEITPWITDGKVKMTADKIAETSRRDYKRPLCLDCVKKARKANADQ